ncbi:hypothetical protein L195_g033712 [Trifolium pratense]|uniref:Uncharacterized protein n=1 Tax=Trifolium pratense TaxID=57577 RepID=A0A2K3LGT1_TRIPR|nr:hypothetical protein L195_g033712 [Trifolium pratense]
MLHSSPKLRHLTIHKEESICPNEVGEVADEYLIPECISSQLSLSWLKEFDIYGSVAHKLLLKLQRKFDF